MQKPLLIFQNKIVLFVVLPFFIISIFNSSVAQVVIKEKVEINPIPISSNNKQLIDTSQTHKINYLENIQRSNIIGDNAQSTVTMPSYGRVTVEVILSDAALSSRVSLEIRQPEYQMLSEYANYNVGFTWTSDNMIQGTSVEFGIDWYWNNWGTIYQGKEAGVITTQIDSTEYTMGFEALGDDWDYNELVIRVKFIPTDIVLIIDPPIILPGDTANVIIKNRLADGSLIDFPPTQKFEAAMLDGCIYGQLKAGTDSGAYLNNVFQPIIFIADTNVIDSGAVLLRVGLVEETALNKLEIQTGLTSDCFTGYFISKNYNNANVSIDNLLSIIYPTENSVEWITEEPQMPSVECKAKLKNYNGGLVTFEWEYWIRYNLYRHAYYSADTLCDRTSMVKITGNSTAYNTETSSWDVPFLLSSVDSVEFISMQPTIPGKPKYGGDCQEKRNAWNEGENIFIGGYVFVQVTAKNSSGRIIGFKQINGGEILGSNPNNIQDIKNYAGTKELKSIIHHESLTGTERWKHFNPQNIDLYYSTFKYTLHGWKFNKKGYPAYGVPNGYGLAKIDNPAPLEMDLWNWKSNIDRGRNIIAVAKSRSTEYISNTGADYDEEKYWMNAFQMYNGGRYWNWVDNKIGWTENPKRPKNNYGKLLYDIYKTMN